MCVHDCGVLVCWHNVKLLKVPLHITSSLCAALPSWWECFEYGCFLTIPVPPILAYYWNSHVDERAGALAVLHITAIEIVIMALVPLFHTAWLGMVGLKAINGKWGRVFVGYPSWLPLELVVVFIITALHLSSSLTLLITSLPIWRIFAQH